MNVTAQLLNTLLAPNSEYEKQNPTFYSFSVKYRTQFRLLKRGNFKTVNYFETEGRTFYVQPLSYTLTS